MQHNRTFVVVEKEIENSSRKIKKVTKTYHSQKKAKKVTEKNSEKFVANIIQGYIHIKAWIFSTFLYNDIFVGKTAFIYYRNVTRL